MVLDTMAIQGRLHHAGLENTLAGAVTREMADAIAQELASKPDLTDLQGLRNELYEVRNELKADIIQVRGEVVQVRDEVAQVRGDAARLESRVADLANEIAGLRNIMADSKVSNARWAIGVTATIALGFAGVIVALVVV